MIGRPRGSKSDSLWTRELTRFRHALVRQYLDAYDGNRTETARALGVSRANLMSILKRLRITDPRPQGRAGRPKTSKAVAV